MRIYNISVSQCEQKFIIVHLLQYNPIFICFCLVWSFLTLVSFLSLLHFITPQIFIFSYKSLAVTQLVKAKSSKVKLNIVIDNNTKSYNFADYMVRNLILKNIINKHIPVESPVILQQRILHEFLIMLSTGSLSSHTQLKFIKS